LTDDSSRYALEGFLRVGRDLRVHARQDPIEQFEHEHPAAEPRPHRTHLEAERARADDDQAIGHFGIGERVGARADPFAVELNARQARDLAARREDHALRADLFDRSRAAIRVLRRRHRDRHAAGPRAHELRVADDPRDPVLLHQRVDPSRQRVGS